MNRDSVFEWHFRTPAITKASDDTASVKSINAVRGKAASDKATSGGSAIGDTASDKEFGYWQSGTWQV